VNLAREPFDDVLREDAGGAEPHSRFHQLQQYVFSVVTDAGEVLQMNHEFPTLQVCSGSGARIAQLGGPRGNELSLHHQATLVLGVKNGDLQHCFLPALATGHAPCQTCRTVTHWIFRRRPREVENVGVEEVETVESVKVGGGANTWPPGYTLCSWENDQVIDELEGQVIYHQARGREQDYAPLSEALPDRRPSPEELCRNWELAERLAQASTRLSPILRRTFQLSDVDGLSARETAQALGIPQGTVKARVARARKKLKQLLQEVNHRRDEDDTGICEQEECTLTSAQFVHVAEMRFESVNEFVQLGEN
jgi:RNA polymerase sigma factor (sigma-70 family)